MTRRYVTTLWVCCTLYAGIMTIMGKQDTIDTKGVFWAYTALIGLWVLKPVAIWLFSYKITIKKKQNK